jgi:diguanylate cyclase (GGDEF)-like protein
LAALLVFVPFGERIVAGAIDSGGSAVSPQLSVVVLLNVALILLSWRRSKDLEKAIAENELAQQLALENASIDHVTGLANRRELMRLLADPENAKVGSKLLLLDVDFFKKVNDVHGHIAGDEVLKRVADFIREEVPAGSCCARLGGDEFAVLMPPADDPLVKNSISRMISRIADPMTLETATVHVSASVGIARIEEGMAAEDALRRADIAMYVAKRTGRNCQVWFDQDMERELLERTKLENAIRLGIARGEFIPHYQPQIDLDTGELIGFEVLARWQSPKEGLLEPADFMHVAEATGLISELSLSVMKKALFEARNWPSHLKIAVNVSPAQFRDTQLAERILKILAETNFPGSRLEIEINESSFLEDRDAALTIVESLKNMGVTISLDDFGTGYANLSQLQALPFDRIKIDKSFVGSLLSDTQSDAIVSTILSLGRALKLPITAEGIEDPRTKEHLARLGCSDGQGWLFGKAVSAEAIRAKLQVEEPSESPAAEPTVVPVTDRRARPRRASGGKRAR